MGKGKEFRTTISIGGDIDPSVRRPLRAWRRLEMLEGVADERTIPSWESWRRRPKA